MEASFFTRHPAMPDAVSFVVFVGLVLIGTLLINSFIFRSFNVVGPSMQPTMHTGDRLIVNRMPVTLSQLQNKSYVPDRGQVIVFENPQFVEGSRDEFIVKRVIAFPGERVTVMNGVLTVYNDENPDGFEPDKADTRGTPKSPTSGDVDTVVADETLFVAGDNREGGFSCDSRGCMGTIPYFDVIGPVGLRLWPIPDIKLF